jgi:hypothetical protein
MGIETRRILLMTENLAGNLLQTKRAHRFSLKTSLTFKMQARDAPARGIQFRRRPC